MMQYRVIKPFSSAGEGGLTQHKVGDIVSRLVLAKSPEYLELTEPARVFVTNPADAQADTGDGSGEALPTADSTVKTGKAQK